MAMTLSELRTEVRNNLKRDTNAMSNARITRFINWSQERIADLHTFEEMRKYTTDSTLDGQKRYSFPSRLKDIFSLSLQDGASSRKLTYVHPREFDSVVPRPEETTETRSAFYVDYGVEYELFPIPDQAYTINIRYSQYPEDLSADTDESNLLRKDQLICAGATHAGFMSMREVEDGVFWQGEFDRLLKEAINTDHNANDWTPVARAFRSTQHHGIGGDYWLNPLVEGLMDA